MTDFTKPQRMSSGAFLVIFCKTSYKVLSAVAIIILIRIFESDLKSDYTSLLKFCIASFGMIVALSLLAAAVDFFSKKFFVKDGNLVVMRGLLQRQTSTIPLDRIHTLRTKRGIIYQVLGLRGITVDTLASKKEEMELILSENDWQSLMDLIEKEETIGVRDEVKPKRQPEGRLIRFDNKNLILDSFCQNHLKGAAIFFGFIVVVLGRLDDYIEDTAEAFLWYAGSYYEELAPSPLMVILSLLALYVVFVLLWMGKVLLRYFDMYLTYTKSLLSFSFGMFARSGCRFAFDKVCTVWVKRNFLERKLGLCTLMLRQAFNATKDKEDDNLKLYGKDASDFFLRWWLGDDYASEEVIISSKSGRGVLLHTLVPASVVAAAVAILLCHFNQCVWIFIPAAYFIISLLNGLFAMRRSRITLKKSHFVVYNGHFADIKNYIKYKDVEVVTIVRTPFTRWFHRVSLELSTPGSFFKVRSLKESEAKSIYENLLWSY